MHNGALVVLVTDLEEGGNERLAAAVGHQGVIKIQEQ